MRLEQSEGYLIALNDIRTIIERDGHTLPSLKEKLNKMIEGCDYELGECYSKMMEAL